MKISCDMAIDLMPLYKDGAASDDSIQALEEHLKTCKDCSRMFRNYSRDVSGARIRSYLEPTRSIERKYSHIANILNRRHMTDTLSMALTVAVIAGTVVYCYMKMSMTDVGE